MPLIPEKAARKFVPDEFMEEKRGKVRDRLVLPDTNLIGHLATDRLSAFDVVLTEIPQKGEILTAMDIMWTRRLKEEMKPGVSFDTVVYGAEIDAFLPPSLRERPDLQRRVIIANRCQTEPIEALPRGYLTGGGFKEYERTAPDHVVSGVNLPAGLRDGDELSESIFTASTKAEEGHDEYIDAKDVKPQIVELAMNLYKTARDFAKKRGVIIADTKFEFGWLNGELVCIDERLTPDSSRFWPYDAWVTSRKGEKVKPPPSMDKQYVRDFLTSIGLGSVELESPEGVAKAHSLDFPQEVILRTNRLYRYIFYLFSGCNLERFQTLEMKIPTRPQRVEIVLGSQSDYEQAGEALWMFKRNDHPFAVHVISCHRNPDALRQYAEGVKPETGVIIAAAGKAAALPGVLQSWIAFYKKAHIPVVGVAVSGKTTQADMAAILSQEELPGNPVILSENGKAFFGKDGFEKVFGDAVYGEFLAPVVPTKDPRLNFIVSD